jgi:uncharacterized membrane-anchored protein YitT (DUF2179 family)
LAFTEERNPILLLNIPLLVLGYYQLGRWRFVLSTVVAVVCLSLVFCTILRSRVADLKYTISTVDPEAFIVIGVAQQVVGGYGQRLPSSALKMSGNHRDQAVNENP